MAITKQDCLLLLTELQDEGIECKTQISDLFKSDSPTIDVLKFINDNKQLDVVAFYEKMRKAYNHKKSKLYINIVKENFDEPKDILTTLASLNLQILLYNKTVQDSTIFLRFARFEEITKCLYNYAKTGDIIPCIKLLQLVKADLKILDYINRFSEENV